MIVPVPYLPTFVFEKILNPILIATPMDILLVPSLVHHLVVPKNFNNGTYNSRNWRGAKRRNVGES